MTGDGLQHAGFWLAAGTAIVWPMRAIDDQTELAALLRHQLAQAYVHGIQSGQIVITSAMPDWLVATATVQPALLSAAIASIEPGMGSHPPPTLCKCRSHD